MIINNHITTTVIDLIEKNFGPDVGLIKGETTKRNQFQ